MIKIIINSSGVPDPSLDPDLAADDAPCVVTVEIPEGLQWPQWVDGQWQEYSVENDPNVI